jgi:nicotinamidase/pyrazinamidase
MKALIVTDIQNDFLPGGSLAVPQGDVIVPILNQLIEKYPLVVATQDWHPQNHKSFASNHQGKKPFQRIRLSGLDQILWPDHCVQGTPGADFSVDLNMNKIEAIFRKGTNPEIDSYSGFFDNGKLKSTGMADYLKGRGVSQLFLCGLAADFCVGYSALDAIEQGFETFVIEDATKEIDSTGWQQMKHRIKSQGGKIIKANDD